jgi:hypothetical protein
VALEDLRLAPRPEFFGELFVVKASAFENALSGDGPSNVEIRGAGAPCEFERRFSSP